MRKKRPQNLRIEDYNKWVKENELEYQPENWVADCWRPVGVSEGSRVVRGERPIRYWNFDFDESTRGKVLPMCQLTYMSLHKLQENPFSQQLHAAHECNNAWCVNPYHITPKTPEENEKDKEEQEGWKTYKKQQRETQLKLRAENKIMPTGLNLKEKAQWILDNNTYVDNKGCMIYTGGKDEKGYGRRNITIATGKRKKVEVHRFVHTAINDLPYGGDDPDDPWNAKGKGFRVAHHTCDEPSCINPDHIELVSRSANAIAAMAYSKARKITEENAREIIEAYLEVEEWPLGSKTTFARHYAEKFGVSLDVTRNLVFRKIRWKPLLQEYGLIKEKN